MKLSLPMHAATTATLLLVSVGGACAAGNVPSSSHEQVAGGVGGSVQPADATSSAQQREKAASILIAVASVQTTDTTEPAKNAVRANAIEGLLPMPGRLEPILRTAFADKSIGIRSVAAMAMGKAKIRSLTEAVQPLTRDSSPLVQGAAVFALQRVGGTADVNVLASMLFSENAQERALAAWILGELGNKSAVPMLMSAAAAPAPRTDHTRDKLMSLQIAEALIKLGKADAIHQVRAALYPGRAEELEATGLAVQILGQVKDQGSQAQLRNLTSEKYDSGNPMPLEIRLACVLSLARMGELSTVPLAESCMADKSPLIRSQCAAVFGETRDVKYLPKLAALMADLDEQVRVTAAAATLKITDGPR